jgi:hypothetical protein
LEDAAYAVIGVCDFAGIEVVGKLRGERFGGGVFYVGVEVVEEEEGFFVFIFFEPLNCEAGGFVGPSFAEIEKIFDGVFEGVVVIVEALVETELGIEDEGADYGAGVELVLF